MKDNLPSSISNRNESRNGTMLSLVGERSKTMPNHRIFQWVDEKGRETKNLTYEQLWNQSGLVANALCNNPDITKGDRVMICYPFGLEFLAGLFGCMRAGVIPCSAYPPNPRMLSTDFPVFLRKTEDAGAKFVLTTAHFRRVMIAQQVLGRIPNKINWIATDKLKHATTWSGSNNTPSVNDDFIPSLDDIAFIQYSSGSTGFPKGVMISHRSLITNCQELTKVCLGTDDVDITRGTVFVAWTPQYHDLGLIGQFMHSIYAAYSAVTFSPLDFIQNPLLWHELIVKYKSVITQGPNFSFGLVSKRLSQKIASWEEITKRKQKQNGRSSTSTLGIYHQKWDTIGCVCIAAEPVDPKVVGQMQSILGIPRKSIQVGYGMAETGVYISNGSGNIHDGTLACGQIDGAAATIRVVNNEGREITQDGVVGEIWVHAPSLVALGYWGQPELSQKTFKNKLEGHDGLWLATGDLGKVFNGEFHVTGRIKDVIIINGKNFFPVDLERTLEEKYSKVLRPGCIVAFQGAAAGVGIVGEVRKGTKREDIPDLVEIRKELTRIHGVSVVYVCLVKAHTIPKTTSGKLKRTAAKDKSLEKNWKSDDVLSDRYFDQVESMVEAEMASGFLVADATEEKGGESGNPHQCEGTIVYGDHTEVMEKLASLHTKQMETSRIRRGKDIGCFVVEEDWFWSEVPGVPPHTCGVGLNPAEHDELAPFIRSIHDKQIDIPFLKNKVKQLLKAQQTYNSEDSYRWMTSVIAEAMLGTDLDEEETDAAAEIQNTVPLYFAPSFHPSVVHTNNNDASFRAQLHEKKSRLIMAFMGKGGLTCREACLFVDSITLGVSHVGATINAALATLYSPDSDFRQNNPDFKLDANNVKQFVWECIRMYPQVEGLVWRDENNHRHAAMISFAGLDKKVWGADAASFCPHRASASEFEKKSCFFAEGSMYKCPAKSLVLTVAEIFLTEFQAASSWRSVHKIKKTNALPYFDRFTLRRLPSIVVVGGGVAGLTCALTLAKRGLKVTVLERNDTIGGHARHTVFEGHDRNPAFGVIHKRGWPNVWNLWDELGVETINLGVLNFQKFTMDGKDLPEPSREEVRRFVKEMDDLVENGNVDMGQTIGEYLDANGYDKNFFSTFILGTVINFFGGCSIQEYLDYPLQLVASKFISDVRGVENPVYRVRNRQYMQAFRKKLGDLGVVMRTGVEPRLVHRGKDGVVVSLGNEETIKADKLVIATPPNAAANFLGDRITWDEALVLPSFDAREETMVLHQDMSWVSKSNPNGLFQFRFPCETGQFPSRDETVAWTVPEVSDTDGSTRILCTYSYANVDDLHINGPSMKMTFTHVRQTPKTCLLQSLLKDRCQGRNNTSFAGGWTQGLMLHEDAVVSGIMIANVILKDGGQEQQEILERPFLPFQPLDESNKKLVTDPHKAVSMDMVSKSSMHKSMRKSMVMRRQSSMAVIMKQTSESNARIIHKSISEMAGREVSMDETMGDLGLSSMELSSLHSKIQTALKMDEEPFPVSKLFDANLTVRQLTDLALSDRKASFSRRLSSMTLDATRLEAICVSLMVEMEEVVGSDVVASAAFGSLGLDKEQKSTYHRAICAGLDLDDDEIPLSWLSETDLTFDALASRIFRLRRVDTVETVASMETESSDSTSSSSQIGAQQPEPTEAPILVAMLRLVIEFISIIIPAVFASMAFLPGAYVGFILDFQQHDGIQSLLILGLMSPVFGIIYTLSATTLLIALKWLLVGRQKPVHQAVWSASFAGRWVVRQCCRFCWRYTPWSWLGGTELLCILYRLLGSKIGKGVDIFPGAIEDFDLVMIGDHSTVEGSLSFMQGTLNTEHVSLGVQTLKPIVVGRWCTISADSMVEQGSTLEDHVYLEKRTMVDRDSYLEKGSRWKGLPAIPSPLNDMEDGLGLEVGSAHLDQSVGAGSGNQQGHRGRYQTVTNLVTFFVLPYIFSTIFGIIVGLGYILWRHLGFWGLGALIWVPISVAYVFVAVLAVLCKWALLGRIQETGSWPLHGSFHLRKWFVDTLILDVLMPMRQFAATLGSPLASSPFVHRQLLKCLGAKIGSILRIHSWMFRSYDLLSIGDGAFFGGGNVGTTFVTENNKLVACPMKIGREVTMGARSILLPGVEMSDYSAASAYSVVGGTIASNEIVVGTETYPRNQSPSIGDDDIAYRIRMQEVTDFCSSAVWWIGAAIITWLIGVLVEVSGTTSKTLDSSLALLYLVAVVGFAFCLGMPLFAALVATLCKISLVGRFFPSILPLGASEQLRSKLIKIVTVCTDTCTPLVMQAFAGTSIEVALYRILGANIGKNVYFDGVWLFEPDLISVGDDVTVNKGSTLSPHHYLLLTVKFGRVEIGKRCTIGAMSTLHGPIRMDGGTEMASMSMPLIGTHLSSGGRWVGYPARKTEERYRQPPKLPLPIWYVLLHHPCSIVLGTFWVVRLFFGGDGGFRKALSYERGSSSGRGSFPPVFQGLFKFDESSLAVSFENGSAWMGSILFLRMPASLCVMRLEDNNKKDDNKSGSNKNIWWGRATYHWTFNSELTVGLGQVSLGFWMIPESILSAKLHRIGRDDGWVWSHSWFGGDPTEEIRLTRIAQD